MAEECSESIPRAVRSEALKVGRRFSFAPFFFLALPFNEFGASAALKGSTVHTVSALSLKRLRHRRHISHVSPCNRFDKEIILSACAFPDFQLILLMNRLCDVARYTPVLVGQSNGSYVEDLNILSLTAFTPLR